MSAPWLAPQTPANSADLADQADSADQTCPSDVLSRSFPFFKGTAAQLQDHPEKQLQFLQFLSAKSAESAESVVQVFLVAD
jgi:hypothetical protein